jgi:hypothetical protein
MARKRRKGEERNGDAASKRQRKLPLDTNVEVLPAKLAASNQGAPAQVSLSSNAH